MPYQQRAESPEMVPQWMYAMDPQQLEGFRQHAAGAPLDQRSFMQAFPNESYASYRTGYDFARSAGAMGEPIALTPPAESPPPDTSRMVREAAEWLATAPLDETGRRKADQLRVKLQQIQDNAHNFPRPGQKEQLLNTWGREFSNSLLETYLDPPPTVADNWSKNIMVDQRTGRRFQQIMRNGEVQFKAIDDESPNKEVNWIAEMYQGDGAKLLRDIEWVQKQHQASMYDMGNLDAKPLSPQKAMERLSAAAQAAATGRWPESVPRPQGQQSGADGGNRRGQPSPLDRWKHVPLNPGLTAENAEKRQQQAGQASHQQSAPIQYLPKLGVDVEYDDLPSGQEIRYIAPDGTIRRKP